VTGTHEDDERDPRQQVSAVIAKILGVALAIGLVIGGGAWVLVKALGLDSADVAGTTIGQDGPTTPLPTTALPVPGQSDDPSSDASGVVTAPPTAANTGLYLSASPVIVGPMERINLTGQWPGHDNESLLVQRFEDGQWADFGVQVHVNIGTFETYVMTGRQGDQKFRVFDPTTQTASNEVTVTIQS
jgi:hypothetical protein